MAAVREAIGGRFELLSPPASVSPNAVRFLGREIDSGQTVTIRLVREGAPGGPAEFSLLVEPPASGAPAPSAQPVSHPPDPASAPTLVASFAATIALPRPETSTTVGPATADDAPAALPIDGRPAVGDLACPTCGATYAAGTKFCARDGASLVGERVGAVAVGQVIADRYRVIRKLGEGGMGEVYLCEHVLMGSPAAIKVLRRTLVSDADAVARFLREARNASRVVHPHVARIYDLGETSDGLVYIAMEYIDGPTLASVLKEVGALPPARVATILTQVADAVAAAHALGIVHRDLKPDNVILAPTRGGIDDVKLLDFGVAKAFGRQDQAVTQSGLVVGTPAYMSPEQLGGRSLDGRSDLYSIAVMAFVMLTGKLPFVGESAEQTMMARLTGQLRGLADVRPDLRFPPALQMVLDRGLAQSPDDRYQSAEEFGRAFDDAVSAIDQREPFLGGGAARPAWEEAATVPVAGRPSRAVGTPAGDAAGVTPSAGSVDAPALAPRAASHVWLPRVAAVLVVAIAVGLWVVRPWGRETGGGTSQSAGDLPGALSSDTGVRGDTAQGSARKGRGRDIVPFDARAARNALDHLAHLSDPKAITDASARRVLYAVPRLLPYFTVHEDSVEALYHAVEARVGLNDSANACRALDSLRPRAAGTRFAVGVNALSGGLDCR